MLNSGGVSAIEAMRPKLALGCVHSLCGLTKDTLLLTALIGRTLQVSAVLYSMNFPRDSEASQERILLGVFVFLNTSCGQIPPFAAQPSIKSEMAES